MLGNLCFDISGALLLRKVELAIPFPKCSDTLWFQTAYQA